MKSSFLSNPSWLNTSVFVVWAFFKKQIIYCYPVCYLLYLIFSMVRRDLGYYSKRDKTDRLVITDPCCCCKEGPPGQTAQPLLLSWKTRHFRQRRPDFHNKCRGLTLNDRCFTAESGGLCFYLSEKYSCSLCSYPSPLFCW